MMRSAKVNLDSPSLIECISKESKVCRMTPKKLFDVPAWEIPKRILTSFVPPVFKFSSALYSDIISPVTLCLSLNIILYYGLQSKNIGLHPAIVLSFSLSFGYWLGLFVFTWTLCSLVGSRLHRNQIFSLCGYSLSGHVIALLLSSFYGDSRSREDLFLTLTTIFGGLSVIRFSLVLLTRTTKPGCRLLVCTFPSILHLLHLIYCFFICIHPRSKMIFTMS